MSEAGDWRQFADSEHAHLWRWKAGQAPEPWMEGITFATAITVERLRDRYESGDRAAALEAISELAPPYDRDGNPDPGPYPPWLDKAAKVALFRIAQSEADSIAEAFDIPQGPGKHTVPELLSRRHHEAFAHAVVAAIRDGRRILGCRYPRGETCYTLAADWGSDIGGWNAEAIQKWAAKSRSRGGRAVWPRLARSVYSSMIEKIKTHRRIPFW